MKKKIAKIITIVIAAIKYDYTPNPTHYEKKFSPKTLLQISTYQITISAYRSRSDACAIKMLFLNPVLFPFL